MKEDISRIICGQSRKRGIERGCVYKMTDRERERQRKREKEREKGRGESVRRMQDGESEVVKRVIGRRNRIMRKSAPFMDSYGSVLGGE